MVRTSDTTLNESVIECEQHNVRGNAFDFSLLNMMWVVGCYIYVLYYVEVCSLYAHFLESFVYFLIMNGCLLLSKSFVCIYWDDYMVLSFNLLMWRITSIDLWILKNPCIPGINPSSSWYVTLYILSIHYFIPSSQEPWSADLTPSFDKAKRGAEGPYNLLEFTQLVHGNHVPKIQVSLCLILCCCLMPHLKL